MSRGTEWPERTSGPGMHLCKQKGSKVLRSRVSCVWVELPATGRDVIGQVGYGKMARGLPDSKANLMGENLLGSF